MKSSPKKSVYARTLTFLTAFVISVALSSCTSSDDAAPDLEDTRDASGSDPTEYIPASKEGPAKNVPEPKFPLAASHNSLEGAQATLEYFWKGVDYVRLTGDSSYVERVSLTDCDLCGDLTSGWSQVYENDSWAVLHDEVEVEVYEVNISKVESLDREMAEISFSMTEPAVDFFEDGLLLEEESFESESTSDWWAQLTFDGTAQSWNIEWVGLESHLVEDET